MRALPVVFFGATHRIGCGRIDRFSTVKGTAFAKTNTAKNVQAAPSQTEKHGQLQHPRPEDAHCKPKHHLCRGEGTAPDQHSDQRNVQQHRQRAHRKETLANGQDTRRPRAQPCAEDERKHDARGKNDLIEGLRGNAGGNQPDEQRHSKLADYHQPRQPEGRPPEGSPRKPDGVIVARPHHAPMQRGEHRLKGSFGKQAAKEHGQAKRNQEGVGPDRCPKHGSKGNVAPEAKDATQQREPREHHRAAEKVIGAHRASDSTDSEQVRYPAAGLVIDLHQTRRCPSMSADQQRVRGADFHHAHDAHHAHMTSRRWQPRAQDQAQDQA